MDKQNLKSKYPIGMGITLLMGCIGSTTAGYYLTTNAFSDEYPQIGGVIIGGCFAIFGLIIFIAILNLKQYQIKDDKLLILSIFGIVKAIVYLDQIISWNEVEKENQHFKWKDLTLHLPDKDIKISSTSLRNYHQFKKVLVRGKRRNEQAETAWFKRNLLQFAIGFIFLGCFFYYVSFILYQNKNKIYQPQEVTTLTSEISNEVKIHKGSRNSRSIRLKFNEYPEYTFILDGVAYSTADKKSFIEDHKRGDVVNVQIATDEFLKKLTKELELEFWDKTVNYRLISIYGLSSNKEEYLTLDDYNKAKLADRKWGFWLLLAFSTFIFGSGVYILIQQRKIEIRNSATKRQKL